MSLSLPLSLYIYIYIYIFADPSLRSSVLEVNLRMFNVQTFKPVAFKASLNSLSKPHSKSPALAPTQVFSRTRSPKQWMFRGGGFGLPGYPTFWLRAWPTSPTQVSRPRILEQWMFRGNGSGYKIPQGLLTFWLRAWLASPTQVSRPRSLDQWMIG